MPKILSGEKTIESRWYKTKCEAWGKVKTGDTVYFKNSGEPVSVKAKVTKVLQFENLSFRKIKEILKKYGNGIGFRQLSNGNSIVDGMGFFNLLKSKKYCALIFLKNPRKVKPFNVDKRGFGAPRAWLTVKTMNQIKISHSPRTAFIRGLQES